MLSEIICTVGGTRSGKSLLARLLQKATNYPIIEVSSLVKEFAGENASRKDLQLEREKHTKNPDWLYNKIKNQVVVNEAQCIISGIREPYLLDRLRKDFGSQNITIYAADIPDQVRRDRIAKLDKKTPVEINADEQRDLDLGIKSVIEQADFYVDTNNPIIPEKLADMFIKPKEIIV